MSSLCPRNALTATSGMQRVNIAKVQPGIPDSHLVEDRNGEIGKFGFLLVPYSFHFKVLCFFKKENSS